MHASRSRNGIIEVACKFQSLSSYPFGNSTCVLEFGSWTYGPRYTDFYPFRDGYQLGGRYVGCHQVPCLVLSNGMQAGM